MLSRGPARKVTIYVNEDSKVHHQPVHEAVLTLLLQRGIAGATATRAMAGFGPHHVLHTPSIEVLAEHLPVRIEFIDTAANVDLLLPELYELVQDGLIEVQDTTIVKAADSAQPAERPPAVVTTQPARMLRIFLGEADRWQDEPLCDAIVKRLRSLEIGGATVYRGIYGYGAKGHTHKERFLHISGDLPVLIAAIDTPEKLARAVPAIEEMLTDGLIVLSEVEMLRVTHETR